MGVAKDKELRARERETQLRVLDAVLPTTYPPPCPPGTFVAAQGGGRVCEPCPVGSFCGGGQALKASPCPVNSAAPSGAANVTQCTCEVETLPMLFPAV